MEVLFKISSGLCFYNLTNKKTESALDCLTELQSMNQKLKENGQLNSQNSILEQILNFKVIFLVLFSTSCFIFSDPAPLRKVQTCRRRIQSNSGQKGLGKRACSVLDQRVHEMQSFKSRVRLQSKKWNFDVSLQDFGTSA